MMNFRYTVTEAEANTILQALAKQPFEQVFQLINSIQTQTREQLAEEAQNKRELFDDEVANGTQAL